MFWNNNSNHNTNGNPSTSTTSSNMPLIATLVGEEDVGQAVVRTAIDQCSSASQLLRGCEADLGEVDRAIRILRSQNGTSSSNTSEGGGEAPPESAGKIMQRAGYLLGLRLCRMKQLLYDYKPPDALGGGGSGIHDDESNNTARKHHRRRVSKGIFAPLIEGVVGVINNTEETENKDSAASGGSGGSAFGVEVTNELVCRYESVMPRLIRLMVMPPLPLVPKGASASSAGNTASPPSSPVRQDTTEEPSSSNSPTQTQPPTPQQSSSPRSTMVAMPLEARKDVALIFTFLLTNPSTSQIFGSYLLTGTRYDDVMRPIVYGMTCELSRTSSSDLCLLCGSMYRATLRHKGLYKRLLEDPDTTTTPTQQQPPTQQARPLPQSTSPTPPSQPQPQPSNAERYVYPLLTKSVFTPNFEVVSDALSTLSEILTLDTTIASPYMQRHYEELFLQHYNAMLRSENYVTKRMSLKLLATILLNRSNFNIMMSYVSSGGNLRIVMELLRDASGNIQLEAFHVFKIFVANPHAPLEVKRMLVSNQEKLVRYLEGFHVEKEDGDEQFRDEKMLLVSTLQGLTLESESEEEEESSEEEE